MGYEGSRPASRYLGVRLTLEPARSKFAVTALSVVAFFLKLYSWTNLVSQQRFVVVVFRRKGAVTVASYTHPTMMTAKLQMKSIRRRLETESIDDMCAHLGIPRASIWQDN